MEAFLPYFLYLLLLPLSLFLVSIIRRNDRGKLPPGSKGWPMLGENIMSAQGPHKFVEERMEKHSPEVFQTSLLGEKTAIFCGLQGNKFVFTNENKLVTTWLPESLTKVLAFSEFLETNMKKESASRRIMHHVVFTSEALKQHIPAMDALAREHLDSEWKPNSVVKVLHLSKKYTFELVCRLFLSVVDPVHVKRLSDPFTVVTNGMISV